MDVIKHPGRGYEALVALPLALVTVFCFGFVMMHPYANPQAATANEISSSTNHTSSVVQSTNVIDISNPLSHLATIPQPAVSPTPATAAVGSTLSSSSISSITKQSSSASTSSLQPATADSGKIIKQTVKNDVDQTLVNLGL